MLFLEYSVKSILIMHSHCFYVIYESKREEL